MKPWPFARPAALTAVVLGASLASGCVKHIKPYEPKRREYHLPVAHPAYDAARATGSLFDPNGPGARLTTDARAQTVNDIVVIAIDEKATAQRDTATETSRDDQQIAALTSFLTVIEKLQKENADFNGATAVNLASASTFKGKGTTSRNDRVQATVPAMVRQVLPNGNLFVEGDRVVMVNTEEHHFYISGVIRPEDIDGVGVVNSSRMADAQIEFTGRGTLTAGTEKGWFSTVLDYIWPF